MQNLSEFDLKEQILTLVKQYAQIALAPKQFIPGTTLIPPAGKLIDFAEISNMVEASLDGWLTTGRFNDQFEKELGKYIGVEHLITVNSGSSANLVAFSTLTSPRLGARAIRPGDEVIAVAAGFPTTVNPIIQCGAVPVFIDIKIGTYNIDADAIESGISHKTKAIMLAHTLGNPYNLRKIKELCEKYNLWLVEDCCDALGSTYDGKHVGTFGDIATLSFYPAHHITMGEGGAVFTNNKELILIAESIRDWGRDCYCRPGTDNTCGKRFCWKLGNLPKGYDHKYIYSHLGFNLKITDMQAACGLAQLKKLNSFVEKRKKNFAFLHDKLIECENDLVMPQAENYSEPSWFGFPLTVRKKSSINRLDIVEYLNQCKIGTRLLFAGNLVAQPYMAEKNYRIANQLSETDTVMNQTFWIGLQPSLSDEMLEYSAKKIKEYVGAGF